MKEKTEKPTPKRLRDARKKGQVPKSKEVATCAAIVGLFIYLWLFFGTFVKHISQMLLLPTAYYEVPFKQACLQCCAGVVKELVLLSVPFALAGVLLVFLAHVMQFGFLVATEPVKPDFKKINPVEGFKRIFSLQNLLELIKSIFKIVLLGTIVYLLIKADIGLLMHVPHYEIANVLGILGVTLKKLVLYVSSLFIIVAILDYFFQKKLYLRKLKMSMDDVKMERKDREGDPQIKRKRRRLHQELISEDMYEKIRSSSVIITYGNKIAAAIYYEYGKTKLPVVQLIGKERMAEKFIQIARQMKRPIFPDPYLARKLVETGKENQYIPPDLIAPIAMLMRSMMGNV